MSLEKHILQYFGTKVGTFSLTFKQVVSTTKKIRKMQCLIIRKLAILLQNYTGVMPAF
jgi:hypothetical protein